MRTVSVVTLLALAAGSAAAQQAADSTAAARPAQLAVRRASWTSDRMPMAVGDIITIVVDEQTAARERVSTVATGQRSQNAGLNATVAEGVRLGPAKGFGTTLQGNSRDEGEANRRGDLTAVLSVRVTEIEPNGVAHISGSKKVIVDGREQQVELQGLVRPEDVTSANLVASSRIADAVITYRGKKIGPRAGILGRILSILWP